MRHISEIGIAAPESGLDAALDAGLDAALDEGACSRCGGMGFVVDPALRPGDDGYGRAMPCGCKEIRRSGVFLRRSGLTSAEQDYSLDYQPTVDRFPREVAAVKAALERGGGILFLFGGYGVGKSGLLMAAVAEACRAGTEAHYTTAPEMMRTIRATFDTQGSSEKDVVDRYCRYPILALDEPEKTKLSEYALDVYQSVIDTRYRHRRSRLTLIATNLIPRQVDGVWRFLGVANDALGYLDDRLQDAARLDMRGESLRGRAR